MSQRSLAPLHCGVKEDPVGNWFWFFSEIILRLYNGRTERSPTRSAERLFLDIPDLPFRFELCFCGMFVVVVLLLVVVLTAPTHMFHPSRTH